MGDVTSVYKYYAANGALLYVGVTARAERRAHEHSESKDWWRLAVGCTLEHFDTRAEAEQREQYLIRTLRPPYNRQHNPERSIPLEQRTAARLSGRQEASIVERRRAFYQLPTEMKHLAPCVVCRGPKEASEAGHPSCLRCHAAAKDRGTARGAKPSRHGQRTHERLVKRVVRPSSGDTIPN